MSQPIKPRGFSGGAAPGYGTVTSRASRELRGRHWDHLAGGKVDERADMVDGAISKQTG